MNPDTFNSICSHFHPNQPILVKTVTGTEITGRFLRYEKSDLTTGFLMMSSKEQTLVLLANQVSRIVPHDESLEDTYPNRPTK